MCRTSYMLCFVVILVSIACSAYSQCIETNGQSGTIYHSVQVRHQSTSQKCWTIQVPENKFIKLTNFTWSMYSQSCNYAYLKINLTDLDETYTFCGSDSKTDKKAITALSNVQVAFYFYDAHNNRQPKFKFQYDIKDIECARKNSFHCSTHSCISKSRVCDGIEDCQNGIDEIGCETGVLSIAGVANASAQAILWLKSQRKPFWGWEENTPRAVTALYLSNGANFNGTNLEEELMAKQSEVKIAIGLLKNPISNEILSMFINSLLVTCHSPRHFYGQNLVKRLKVQLESRANFTHPIVYLTLCNANESWTQGAPENLIKVLRSNSEYPFVKDIQSYAVMAVSCYINNSQINNKMETTNLSSQVKKALESFKKSQLSDGSFGNLQTTALVTQALMAGGEEHAKNWNLTAAVKFLIKELNSTDIDFSSVYLSLPVFNGKSLTHIFKVNCTGNPRRRIAGNLKSDIDDNVGPKMRIQYSLFMGDDKDIIHTIYLRVPENYTAQQVMQYAWEEDKKYKYEWKMISGKMYVYKIGKVINDPDLGKFWLLHLGSSNSTDILQTTTSPDKITLNEGQHLVMWYKTTTM